MGGQNPFLLFRVRGEGWCAAPPGFRNLLRDPIGRGETRAQAISELLAHPEFIFRGRMGEWPLHPHLGAFVEMPEPENVTSDRAEFSREESNRSAAFRRRAIKLVWDRDAQTSFS
jgi:hypothetical protein